MSELQLQAVNMIDNMTDESIAIVINFMKDLKHSSDTNTKKQALQRMKDLREETADYLLENYNPEKSRKLAMEKKYGRIS